MRGAAGHKNSGAVKVRLSAKDEAPSDHGARSGSRARVRSAGEYRDTQTGWLGELDSNRRDAVDLAREARSAGVFRNLRQEDGARETGWLRAGFEPSLWRQNLPCFCATALLATLSE
jgi:hypothetical protein